MGTSRRKFLRNTFLGVGLLSGKNAWAGTNRSLAGQSPLKEASAAAPGGAALPKGKDPWFPGQPLGRARIEPTLAKLQPGAQQQFRAIIAAPVFSFAHLAEEAKWTVNGIEGGNAQVGTINATGLYRAPAQAPVPHEVHICAEVEGVMNRYLFATVLVGVSEASYELKSSWTDKAHRMKFPHGISLDPQGNLMIADSVGNKAFRFSRDGKLLTEIGAGSRSGKAPKLSQKDLQTGNFGGAEPGYFSGPRVAISDASGMIYVVDTQERRPQIQVFDTEGRFQYDFGQHGTLPGYLIRVHGMAFDSKGRLHAEDVEHCRINIYDRTGKFLSSWGHEGALPGDLNAPHGLYIDPNDEVFVIGYYGPTQKFTAGGHFLQAFAYADPPDHPISFQSLCGDRWGNVYIPMREEGLAKFSNTGDFIGWVTNGVGVQWAAVDNDGNVYALPVDVSPADRQPLPTVAVYSEQ
jgi:hypothetical protein